MSKPNQSISMSQDPESFEDDWRAVGWERLGMASEPASRYNSTS